MNNIIIIMIFLNPINKSIFVKLFIGIYARLERMNE